MEKTIVDQKKTSIFFKSKNSVTCSRYNSWRIRLRRLLDHGVTSTFAQHLAFDPGYVVDLRQARRYLPQALASSLRFVYEFMPASAANRTRPIFQPRRSACTCSTVETSAVSPGSTQLRTGIPSRIRPAPHAGIPFGREDFYYIHFRILVAIGLYMY
jgi:hypothetical protein